MGLYNINCPVCNKEFVWFSGNTDQRCDACRQAAEPCKVTMFNNNEHMLKAEREKAVEAVMSLYFALKEIGGKPTLRDLVKLAKRIRGKNERD